MSVLYAMPGNEAFTGLLARHSGQSRRELHLHRFPDGESLVRIEPAAEHADAVIVCTLDHPDPKLVPLLMAAATVRELGARRIGLIAPYLAYMRQDTRFHPGEALSASILGRLLGGAFDWLITVDPHLHRYRTLDEACPLDGRVIHAAPRVAAWIRSHVQSPLIIGPDGESAQWVNDVAGELGAPCVVASKERHGDRDVRVRLPGIEQWANHTPVLLDDIISSGHTMVETLCGLAGQRMAEPVCIGVHGIFADAAMEKLRAAGAGRIVTSNTIPGETAVIDISEDVALLMAEMTRGEAATSESAIRGTPA